MTQSPSLESQLSLLPCPTECSIWQKDWFLLAYWGFLFHVAKPRPDGFCSPLCPVLWARPSALSKRDEEWTVSNLVVWPLSPHHQVSRTISASIFSLMYAPQWRGQDFAKSLAAVICNVFFSKALTLWWTPLLLKLMVNDLDFCGLWLESNNRIFIKSHRFSQDFSIHHPEFSLKTKKISRA